jgi:hypothetical protein
MTVNNNFLKFLPAGEILDTALLFPGDRVLRLSSNSIESYISRRGEYFGLAMCLFMRPTQGPCILLSGSSCFTPFFPVGGWEVAWHPNVNNLGPHIIVTVVDAAANKVYCQRFPVDLRSQYNNQLSIKSLEVEFFRGFGVDCWVNGQRIPSGGSAGSSDLFIDPGSSALVARSCAMGGDIQGSLTRNKASSNILYQGIAGLESDWDTSGNYLEGGVIWTLIERDRHPTQENNFPGAIMEFGVGAGIPLYDIDFTLTGGPRQVVEINKPFTPNDPENGFRWQDTNNTVFTDDQYITDFSEVLVPILKTTDEYLGSIISEQQGRDIQGSGENPNQLIATYFRSIEHRRDNDQKYDDTTFWQQNLQQVSFATQRSYSTVFPEVYYDDFNAGHGVDVTNSSFVVGPGSVTYYPGQTNQTTDVRDHFGVPQIWLRRITNNLAVLSFIDDESQTISTDILGLLPDGAQSWAPSGSSGATLSVLSDFYVPRADGGETNLLGDWTITAVQSNPCSEFNTFSPSDYEEIDTRRYINIGLLRVNHGISLPLGLDNIINLIEWLESHPSGFVETTDASAAVPRDPNKPYRGLWPQSRLIVENTTPDVPPIFINKITASPSPVNAFAGKIQRLRIAVQQNNPALPDSGDSINFHTSIYAEQNPKSSFNIGDIIYFTPEGITNEGPFTIRGFATNEDGDVIVNTKDGEVIETEIRGSAVGTPTEIYRDNGPSDYVPYLEVVWS